MDFDPIRLVAAGLAALLCIPTLRPWLAAAIRALLPLLTAANTAATAAANLPGSSPVPAAPDNHAPYSGATAADGSSSAGGPSYAITIPAGDQRVRLVAAAIELADYLRTRGSLAQASDLVDQVIPRIADSTGATAPLIPTPDPAPQLDLTPLHPSELTPCVQ